MKSLFHFIRSARCETVQPSLSLPRVLHFIIDSTQNRIRQRLKLQQLPLHVYYCIAVEWTVGWGELFCICCAWAYTFPFAFGFDFDLLCPAACLSDSEFLTVLSNSIFKRSAPNSRRRSMEYLFISVFLFICSEGWVLFHLL